MKTRTLSLLLITSLATCVLASVSRTMQSMRFPVTTPQGSQAVDAAEQFTDLTYAAGLRGAVIVFFEPERRTFWWGLELAAPGSELGLLEPLRERSILYLQDDTLVFFTMRGWSLAIRASSEHANSLEEAARTAIARVHERRAEWSTMEAVGRGRQLYRLVDLSELGVGFFNFTDRADPPPKPKVVGVSAVEGRWEVTVRGPNKDEAVIVLNSSFDLQEIRRVLYGPSGN